MFGLVLLTRVHKKSSSDRESPWKIPDFIFIGFDLRLPFWWVRLEVVSHIDMFIQRKFIKTGEILNMSQTFNIQLNGTLPKVIQ